MDQITLRRAADLPGVEESGGHGFFHGGIQIRVRKDNERVISPKLQHNLLQCRGSSQGDMAADLARPGQRDRLNPGVGCEDVSKPASLSGQHLDGSVREPGLLKQRAQTDHRQRVVGCGLHDHTVAGKERRGNLLAEKIAREVERKDAGNHAERHAADHDQIAGLVCFRADGKNRPVQMTCFLDEKIPGKKDVVDLDAGLRDLLAGLPAQGDGQLFAVFFDKLQETARKLCAVKDRRMAPSGKCARRGQDRSVYIFSGSCRHRVEQIPGVGIRHFDYRTRAGRHKCSVDQHIHGCSPVCKSWKCRYCLHFPYGTDAAGHKLYCSRSYRPHSGQPLHTPPPCACGPP